MAKMRAVQVARPSGPFELVERDIPQPGPREVRIKVQACGLCHSDVLTKEGLWPGISYPRIPGHEIAGVIDAVGSEVPRWKQGQRVGVGWMGSYCGYCDSCRRGDFMTCENLRVSGISMDGGYADYVVVPFGSVALIPDEMTPVEAGPLMCAGVTTFNPLRNSGTRAGETVAVLGIGGLGHLGIQFASKMGFRTIAIARGMDKEPLARQLGAHHYIDSLTAGDVSAALQKLGGAKIVLATASNAEAMAATVGGLAVDGRLIVLGADYTPMKLVTTGLIFHRTGIYGWPSGTSIDSEDTMRFSAMTGIRPMVETFPLEKVADAYERMMSNKARFRAVITTGN